jgi:hypothetical protein
MSWLASFTPTDALLVGAFGFVALAGECAP